MGYMRHHAIVVTGTSPDRVERAWEAAKSAGLNISPVVRSPCNGHYSFFAAPDGSKEGWDTSREGDEARSEFIDWLRHNSDDVYVDWVEVQYGDDDRQTLVCRHSDDGK